MYLIIQTGDPVTPAKNAYGHFSDWFIQGLQVLPSEAMVVNVHLGEALPANGWAVETLTAIIITGSPAMVTEGDAWMSATQSWLEQIMSHDIPILGVCFGHQMLADLLGGQVGYNQRGRNLGLSEFILNQNAASDALLGEVHAAGSIPTLASHLQHVIQLPESAVLLGRCDKDDNHAFRVDEHIWGLQFHPEWTPAITQAYIQARQQELIAEGIDPVILSQQLKPCDQAWGLLHRFKTLAASRRIEQAQLTAS